MGNFNRDRSSGNSPHTDLGGRRTFGNRGPSNFNRNGRNDRQMFRAICTNCGKDCQVPFRPTGDKPVYCSDCFGKLGSPSEKRFIDRSGRENGNSGNYNLKVQLEVLNSKLDKIIDHLQLQPIREDSFRPKSESETTIENTDTKPSKSKKVSKQKATTVEG